jgi:hypothetical protein
MMPVKKPRGPSPEQIRRRRIAALTGAVAALIAIVIAVVVAIPHVRGSHAATTIVAPAPPKPFRVVFPEGFDRAQMAERVQAVAKIAQRKRGRPVALNSKQYLLATKRAVLP